MFGRRTVVTEWTLVPRALAGTWAVLWVWAPGPTAALMPSLSCYLAPALALLLSSHVRLSEPYSPDKADK